MCANNKRGRGCIARADEITPSSRVDLAESRRWRQYTYSCVLRRWRLDVEWRPPTAGLRPPSTSPRPLLRPLSPPSPSSLFVHRHGTASMPPVSVNAELVAPPRKFRKAARALPRFRSGLNSRKANVFLMPFLTNARVDVYATFTALGRRDSLSKGSVSRIF